METAENSGFLPLAGGAHTAQLDRFIVGGGQLAAERVSILGVDYVWLRTSDGGDLYLTRFGLPVWRSLLPENWYSWDWIDTRGERLQGTSTIYKVPTRPVAGASYMLVVKWSRVGETVPVDTLTVCKFVNAEFNSPFEEFALLMELRRNEFGPRGIRIRTQHPLGIYVPSQKLQLWQTGRSEEKIRAKIARHPGIELDILRQYVLLFGWIDGVDAVRAAELLGLSGRDKLEFTERLVSLANHELRLKGYRMIDMKPEHIIVRVKGNDLLRDRNKQVVYALVDYELLERTPEHEQSVRAANRRLYLVHMARRFEQPTAKEPPAHLRQANVLGVDYITGRAESTGGVIWVVGRDPDLFNFFLPERWRRTPARKLSGRNQVFYTRTKDDINLVWRVSRVGENPWVTAKGVDPGPARDYGYNSPFEEFAIALEIASRGMPTVYPRAIYMTGKKTRSGPRVDMRRFELLKEVKTAEGVPVLQPEYDYITIWGFWNGPDEFLAEHDGMFFTGINAAQALKQRLINQDQLADMMRRYLSRLRSIGFEDLNPKPDHLLLTIDPNQKLVCDTDGYPELRICNFELLRPLETPEWLKCLVNAGVQPGPSPFAHQ